MRAVARGAGRVLSLALLLAVLAVATVALVIPKVAGAVPLTVLSGSMEPTMPVGSLAVVRPTMDTLTGTAATLDAEEIDAVNAIEDIAVGDVIVFAPSAGEDKLVIHRVIGMSVTSDGRRTFTTQGDNNSAVDDPVAGHQVRAVLWYHVPLLGYVNDALDGETRRVVAIAFAAMGYAWAAALFVRAIRGDRRRGADGATPEDGREADAGYAPEAVDVPGSGYAPEARSVPGSGYAPEARSVPESGHVPAVRHEPDAGYAPEPELVAAGSPPAGGTGRASDRRPPHD